MVINGEKAPAFNATTLTLPKPQLDNTPLIIENTRRLFSRNRADIEKEIAETIAVPETLLSPRQRRENNNQTPMASNSNLNNQTAPRPNQAPNTLKWPTGIKPVDFSNNNISQNQQKEYPVYNNDSQRPRRKRNRSKKPRIISDESKNMSAQTNHVNGAKESFVIDHNSQEQQ